MLDHWAPFETLAPWEIEVGMRVQMYDSSVVLIVHGRRETKWRHVDHDDCPDCPGHDYIDWSHVGVVLTKIEGYEDEPCFGLHNPVHLKRAA